ncbi:signal peptidase I [Streptomyces sp. NPDC047046]|uniref:signal peptidase I n=1 Tax=Streptomyces sp. NPDC047046 TaxID=3155378 RepID=UPI0033EAE098
MGRHGGQPGHRGTADDGDDEGVASRAAGPAGSSPDATWHASYQEQEATASEGREAPHEGHAARYDAADDRYDADAARYVAYDATRSVRDVEATDDATYDQEATYGAQALYDAQATYGTASPTRRDVGRVGRRARARRVARRRRRATLREIPLLLGAALLIALVLKTFFVQAFVIPSGSMEETLRIGDRVAVDKLTPWFGADVHRGDVVVFRDPGGWLGEEGQGQDTSSGPVRQLKKGLAFIGLLPSADEKDLIKRVVGVGGDTVACCDARGRVTVNGQAVEEPYVRAGNRPSEVEFRVHVPAGRLFVLGDHRANSGDSRFHPDAGYDGTVSEDAVVGRAVAVVWPLGHWSTPGHRERFARVPDAASGWPVRTEDSHSLAQARPKAGVALPTPAELPLVMGVVGPRLLRRGQWLEVRRERGGRRGGRPVGTRGAGRAGAGRRGTGRRRRRAGA